MYLISFYSNILLALCILLTDQIASGVFKPVFQRLRPCHQEDLKKILVLYENHCGGQYGFISSHAANIWGWVILYFHLSKIPLSEKIFWITVSFLISISRMMLGVHFLSDLIVASILGCLIGYGVGHIFFKKSFLN